MNWISKLLAKRDGILRNKTEKDILLLPVNQLSPLYSNEGALYTFPNIPKHISSFDNLKEWAVTSELGGQLALYLSQLVEDGIGTIHENSFLLSWSDIYYLHASRDHEDSLELLSLPKIKKSILNLEERGILSDKDFSVIISGYIDSHGRLVQVHRTGAIFSKGNDVWMATPSEWRLISTINDLVNHTETNQKEREFHWGKIREEALNAGAKLSPYLSSVIVLTPDNLIINYLRQESIGIGVAVIEPLFNDAPEEWLAKFDELSSIPKHIDFISNDGRVRVIFSEPVQSVLQTIKTNFPGRRAGGAKAEAFIRNPFAYLGDDASKVIDPAQIENAKARAGIVPTRLTLLNPNVKNGRINEIVGLIQQVFEGGMGKTTHEKITSPQELSDLIELMRSGCIEERQFFRWRNNVIDIDGDTEHQLNQADRILGVWKTQIDSIIKFDDIYTFDDYHERVAGIGIAKPIYSPYIQKNDGDKTPWAPEYFSPFVNVQLSPDAPPTSIPLDLDWFEKFKDKIDQAKVTGQSNITDSRLPFPISIQEAEPLLTEFINLLNSKRPSCDIVSADVKINDQATKIEKKI